MKKITLFSIIIFWFSSFNCLSQNNPIEEKTHVELGFNGEDCLRGRDVCSDNAFNMAEHPSSVQMGAEKISNNSVKVVLFSNQFSQEEQIKIAGKPFSSFEVGEEAEFIQNYDYVIAEETLQTLTVDISYQVLRAGSYIIRGVENGINIFFTLSQQ